MTAPADLRAAPQPDDEREIEILADLFRDERIRAMRIAPTGGLHACDVAVARKAWRMGARVAALRPATSTPADHAALAAAHRAHSDRVRAILRTEAAAVGLVGCGDNSCRFVPPSGMATNGGCRCEPRHSHWTAEEQDAVKELIRRSAGLVRRLAERIAKVEPLIDAVRAAPRSVPIEGLRLYPVGRMDAVDALLAATIKETDRG